MKHLAFVSLAAFLAIASAAPPLHPERVVGGHTVISARDPKIHIGVPDSATYLGAERWNLYDIADCEIHVFVDAGPNRVVRRLYWIQFEGFLAPEKHYDYSKDAPQQIQGLDFRVNARFGPTAEPPRAGSDFEHVRKMIADAGYKLPADLMNVRLVHLLDDSKNRELMVIYSEDLAPTGFTSAQLRRGDDTAPEWQALQKALVERAAQRVRFMR